jgi:hypothetical protein
MKGLSKAGSPFLIKYPQGVLAPFGVSFNKLSAQDKIPVMLLLRKTSTIPEHRSPPLNVMLSVAKNLVLRIDVCFLSGTKFFIASLLRMTIRGDQSYRAKLDIREKFIDYG